MGPTKALLQGDTNISVHHPHHLHHHDIHHQHYHHHHIGDTTPYEVATYVTSGIAEVIMPMAMTVAVTLTPTTAATMATVLLVIVRAKLFRLQTKLARFSPTRAFSHDCDNRTSTIVDHASRARAVCVGVLEVNAARAATRSRRHDPQGTARVVA